MSVEDGNGLSEQVLSMETVIDFPEVEQADSASPFLKQGFLPVLLNSSAGQGRYPCANVPTDERCSEKFEGPGPYTWHDLKVRFRSCIK